MTAICYTLAAELLNRISLLNNLTGVIPAMSVGNHGRIKYFLRPPFFFSPGVSPCQDAPSARWRATAALRARYCVLVRLLKHVQRVLSDTVC